MNYISNCCGAKINNPDANGHGHCSECGDTCTPALPEYNLTDAIFQRAHAWINGVPCPTHRRRRIEWNAGEMKPGAVCSVLDDAGIDWVIVDWAEWERLRGIAARAKGHIIHTPEGEK